MPGTGGFICPRCQMVFSSRPLLQAHEEKLCLGTPAASSSCLPGGDPPPAEGAPGTVGRPQDIPVGMSHAEPRHLLVLPGLSPAVQGQRGLGRARGAPLGDVLTPRERALLRAADPASRRLAVEGEPSQRPAPPRGHRQQPQELLEAHERHVAEIQARTQQLEQQREGLCRRLAALRTGAGATPRPEQGELERSRAPEVLQDQGGWLSPGGAALRLDTLLPGAGPLAAEARALRLAYLHAGGHNPAILDQLLELQVEATALEKGPMGLRGGRRMAPAVRAEPPSAGAQGLDAALLAVEVENQRLEDELLALKARRERQANAGSRAAQQHMEELAQLQAEVAMLRCHMEQTGPRLPQTILPPPVAPQLLPALPVPELFMESPGPALVTGTAAAPSHRLVPPSLPLAPFTALEDPPPAQDTPAQHKPPGSSLLPQAHPHHKPSLGEA
ncbi:unnamed protein product [Bubo scandiacus]